MAEIKYQNVFCEGDPNYKNVYDDNIGVNYC